ncbi:MAG: peptidyl-prolyl cis-trans isomerase [Acidobacteria bacterium]|nr:peptidyl-prolyl cis-trans isomerase [Acidobacteriota bacterium]
MTMLDGMRRHKGWLKWSLALVCLAFVFLYVPGFVDQTALEGFPNDVVAQVGEYDITVAQFRQMYLLQLENYRQQSSGEVSEEVLRSLGIDRQILQGMIARYAAVAEAERLGLSVSDAEVRHRIVNLPGFQVNGQFVGEARYRQTLQFQRPPMTPAQFEEEVRRDIMFERLEAAVTGWIAVSDDEIAAEHRRRNEKVRVQVVAFRGDDYREDTEATEDEVEALYEENPLSYELPEKRQLRFLLVDESAIFESISPSNDEVQQYYDANISQYTTPGQVRASHILLRVGDQDEAEVEARAAELATEARGGADFAELAREHSEDEANAEDGGDLGMFGRGRMVAEVEAAAFDMEVDDVSDPVRSAIGFHVLRVTEKQEQTAQPLEEVREAIENTLKNERATSRADDLARAIAAEVETPEDLERAAGARGFELQESGFVGRGEPILGLGFAPQVSAEAFQMEQGDVAGPIQTPTGPAFVTVTALQDPVIPPLEEVREDVARDVRSLKALERAREQADAAAESLRDGEDFAAAAEEAGLTVATSELITRGAAFPEVGISTALEQAAFGLPIGGVSGVLEVGGETLAIVRLVEREDVTPEQIAEASDAVRGELLQTRRNEFYSAYMSRVQEQLGVDIDYAAFETAVGT